MKNLKNILNTQNFYQVRNQINRIFHVTAKYQFWNQTCYRLRHQILHTIKINKGDLNEAIK
jgi:hypothetical protein